MTDTIEDDNAGCNNTEDMTSTIVEPSPGLITSDYVIIQRDESQVTCLPPDWLISEIRACDWLKTIHVPRHY